MAEFVFRRLAAAVLGGAILIGAGPSAPMPARKSGLWQNTMTITDMTMNGKRIKPPAKSVVTVICDPGNDLRMQAPAQDAQAHCPAPVVTGDGKNYAISETCKLPDGGTTEKSGTLVFDGDTATHLVMRMTSPAMSDTMRLDSKWLGACPAGAAPGDFGQMVKGKFKKMQTASPAPP